MAGVQPRVQSPGIVDKDEIFEVRTLISHPMETGLRRDGAGKIIPRDLIHRFSCRYNNDLVFSVDLHEAMAANPFLAFHLRAGDSGRLQFAWEEDDGTVTTLEAPITVRA
jgi:sulfur-oxidizing protein SoxZ